MIMQRRKFLLSAAVAIAAPAICTPAWAQEYPTRPVRIIVGFAAGGASDITARLMGQWLSERLGQPFIIENRPGANTNIAAEAAITAAADGYTLLFTTVSNAVNATLYENLRFKFVRDTVPVAGIALGTYVMVVNPSVPARTVPQLIAYTKDNLDKVSMASAGIGSGPHVAGELFKTMTGARMVHVPYRGDAPALTDRQALLLRPGPDITRPLTAGPPGPARLVVKLSLRISVNTPSHAHLSRNPDTDKPPAARHHWVAHNCNSGVVHGRVAAQA